MVKVTITITLPKGYTYGEAFDADQTPEELKAGFCDVYNLPVEWVEVEVEVEGEENKDDSQR